MVESGFSTVYCRLAAGIPERQGGRGVRLMSPKLLIVVGDDKDVFKSELNSNLIKRAAPDL